MNSSYLRTFYASEKLNFLKDIYKDILLSIAHHPYVKFVVFLSVSSCFDAPTSMTSILIFINKNNLIECGCCSINTADFVDTVVYFLEIYNNIVNTYDNIPLTDFVFGNILICDIPHNLALDVTNLILSQKD
jgi:hypothetical protein